LEVKPHLKKCDAQEVTFKQRCTFKMFKGMFKMFKYQKKDGYYEPFNCKEVVDLSLPNM
jgi:hypothetical protein